MVSFDWLWFYIVIIVRNMFSRYVYVDSVYLVAFVVYSVIAALIDGRIFLYKRFFLVRWRYVSYFRYFCFM